MKQEKDAYVKQKSNISIIIPVYNCDKYLDRCIRSVLHQTYKDFELILVDDGSSDNSGMLCDKAAEEDSRITVIHKANGGAADARNVGIETAKGRYISFVDSDDVVHPQYLEVLFNVIERASTDICLCYHFDFGDSSVPGQYDFIDIQSINEYKVSGREICKKICDYSEAPQYVAPWAKLYKKECFESIRYPVNRMNEDQFVTYKVVYGREVAIVPLELYGYFSNPNSLSNSGFSIKRYDNLYAVDEAIAFYLEKKDTELAEKARELRQLISAMFIFYSKEKKIDMEIPEQYKMNIISAGRVVFRSLGNDSYEWHMAKVHPNYITLRAYYLRIKKELYSLFGNP